MSALVSDVFGSTSEDDEQPASSGITMVQAPWLEVTAPAPIPSNRDGESEPESKRWVGVGARGVQGVVLGEPG